MEVERALLKPETRRLYAADWAAFALWCRNGNQTALPADAANAVRVQTQQQLSTVMLQESDEFHERDLGAR